MLSAILGFLPWYVWVVAIVLVVAIVGLGLGPSVIALARLVPLPVWCVLAVLAVGLIWLRSHDARLTAEVTAGRDKFWKAREVAAQKNYDEKLAALMQLLRASEDRAREASEREAINLAKLEADHQRRFDALKNDRRKNVTEKAIADCHLTRGVIVQFNAGATAANADGADGAAAEPAAAAGSESPDDRSDVALDQYTVAVEDTQRALGAARKQVAGWQRYYAGVIQPWIASTQQAFDACIPKDAP